MGLIHRRKKERRHKEQRPEDPVRDALVRTHAGERMKVEREKAPAAVGGKPKQLPSGEGRFPWNKH